MPFDYRKLKFVNTLQPQCYSNCEQTWDHVDDKISDSFFALTKPVVFVNSTWTMTYGATH